MTIFLTICTVFSSIFITGLTHEYLHYTAAKICKIPAQIHIKFPFHLSVTHTHTTHSSHIIFIASFPALTITLIGLLVPSDTLYLFLIKIICLSHLLSLAPWRPDGTLFFRHISMSIRHLININATHIHSPHHQDAYAPTTHDTTSAHMHAGLHQTADDTHHQ